MAKKQNRINAKLKKELKKKESNVYSDIQKEKNKIENEKMKELEMIQERERMEKQLEKSQDLSYWAPDDKEVKYIRVYSTIHDKSCYMLDVNDKDIQIPLERYDRTLNQCDICELRSYIRMATNNFNAITFYEKVFLTNMISKEFLRKFFLEKGITIDARNSELYFDNNGEKWKISFKNSMDDCGQRDVRKPILYHNNYVCQGGERIIIDGYHKQIEEDINLYQCLYLIANYSYGKHVKKTEEIKKMEEYERAKLEVMLPYKETSVDTLLKTVIHESDSKEEVSSESDNYTENIQTLKTDMNEVKDNIDEEIEEYDCNQNIDSVKSSLNTINQLIKKQADKYTMITAFADMYCASDDLLRKLGIDKEDVDTIRSIKEKYRKMN